MRDFKPILRKEKRIFFTLFFLHFFLQSYCQIEDPFHPVFENDGTPWYNSDLKRQEGFRKIIDKAKNTMSSYPAISSLSMKDDLALLLIKKDPDQEFLNSNSNYYSYPIFKVPVGKTVEVNSSPNELSINDNDFHFFNINMYLGSNMSKFKLEVKTKNESNIFDGVDEIQEFNYTLSPTIDEPAETNIWLDIQHEMFIHLNSVKFGFY